MPADGVPTPQATEQPAKPKRPVGAPPLPFDQAIADHVCDRIATEAVSMKTICSDEGMPSDVTIWKWIHKYPEFASQYARAKEAQQHVAMDETIDIADDARNDYMERHNFDGAETGWHLNGEAVARSRLRIDNRRWIAGRLARKTYGDKLDIDQTVGVTGDLGSLMERIATGGKRLGGNDEPKGE